MADILIFRARPRSEHEPKHFAESATILFFTGVRYQRMEDAAEIIAPKSRRNGKSAAPRRTPRKRA